MRGANPDQAAGDVEDGPARFRFPRRDIEHRPGEPGGSAGMHQAKPRGGRGIGGRAQQQDEGTDGGVGSLREGSGLDRCFQPQQGEVGAGSRPPGSAASGSPRPVSTEYWPRAGRVRSAVMMVSARQCGPLT